MTVVNPKSISGINSITTGSGSDNLLTIHTSDASSTERVRINSSGDVIVGSGITVSPDGDIFTTGVTTATTFVGALTGNVTGNATGLSGTPNISAGTIAGSTGTFTGDVDIADKIVHTGDTDTAIRFSAADTISIETGGITRATVTGNTIDFPDAGTLRFGASNDLQIYHGSGGASNIIHSNTSQPLIINASGAGTIRFDTNSNERARISSTGQLSVNTTADITGANVAIGGSVRLVNPTGQSATITALPSGTYNTGVSGGSAIVFHRFSDSGGGSDEIAFETHHQGTRHGEAARFNKSGNLAFPSGQGIDFSATANSGGSMSSELLDDYEEGTFTPTFYYVSGTSGVAYNVQEGRYTKIGRNVSFQLRLQLTSKGTGTNNIRISGLPFTPETGGVNHDYFHTSVVLGMNLGSGTLLPFAQMEDYSAGRITLYSYDYSSSSNYGTIGASQIADNFYIGIQGNYITLA